MMENRIKAWQRILRCKIGTQPVSVESQRDKNKHYFKLVSIQRQRDQVLVLSS